MINATETNNRGEGDVWKGLMAGLIGGLIASWTMNRFQDVWWKLSVNDHSTALTSHLVYGLTAEVVRRALRRAL